MLQSFEILDEWWPRQSMTHSFRFTIMTSSHHRTVIVYGSTMQTLCLVIVISLWRQLHHGKSSSSNSRRSCRTRGERRRDKPIEEKRPVQTQQSLSPIAAGRNEGRSSPFLAFGVDERTTKPSMADRMWPCCSGSVVRCPPCSWSRH